jgi:hypothetical protein
MLEQKHGDIRGGCSDLDCLPARTNCYIRQECDDDSDCYGLIYACDDQTQETTCQPTSSGSRPCYYNPAHYCLNKKKVYPECGGTRCLLGVKVNNYCAGMAREWIRQCYDGWL